MDIQHIAKFIVLIQVVYTEWPLNVAYSVFAVMEINDVF